MYSDLEIARFLQRQYDGETTAFDFFDPGDKDGICWASKCGPDGVNHIFLRGSTTFQDWMRDLVALASPFRHDALGPVHPGFLMGMSDLRYELYTKYGAVPMVIAGHSLGAGRADILSALMTVDVISAPPLRTVCFGEPKPGFDRLGAILARIPRASYRNGDGKHHDLVTDVPLSFPPEEYVHPSTLIEVSKTPGNGDKWGPFAYHHLSLYIEALSAGNA